MQNFKYFLVSFLIFSLALPALAGVDPSNTFKMGTGAANDKKIIFNRGGSNPAIKWSEGSSQLQFSTDGTTFYAFAASGTDSSIQVTNLGIAASVASNQLTVALKGKDGNDPSASNTVSVGFRNATAAIGTYAIQNFTAAASITLAATDSIGCAASAACTLYVYLVKDTTSEVCLSFVQFDEGLLQSASALTGGADTSGTTLWCQSAHTSKPIRVIGRLTGEVWSNPNWAAPTTVSTIPFRSTAYVLFQAAMQGSGVIPDDTALAITSIIDTHGAYSAGTFTVPVSGGYLVYCKGETYGNSYTGFLKAKKNGSTIGQIYTHRCGSTAACSDNGQVTVSDQFAVGDTITCTYDQNSGSASYAGLSAKDWLMTVFKIGNE